MRISRACYDKRHRCPGWAGGGMRFAKVDRCVKGYVTVDYGDRWWKWKIHRCPTCDVRVLPDVIRWLDWRWVSCEARRKASDAYYNARRWGIRKGWWG